MLPRVAGASLSRLFTMASTPLERRESHGPLIPDLMSLALFVHAVDSRSLSKAAQRSHIALAAASRRIAFLEEMFDVSLLDRSSHGVKPTLAGTALAQHARQILQNVERLNAELSEHASGIKGWIRLHANTSAMTQFLPAQLASFAAQFPDIRFQLEEQRSLVIVQALAQGATDIGIIVKGPPTPGLEAFPYRKDNLVALVPKAHPMRMRKVAFERLLECDFASLETQHLDHPDAPQGSVRCQSAVAPSGSGMEF